MPLVGGFGNCGCNVLPAPDQLTATQFLSQNRYIGPWGQAEELHCQVTVKMIWARLKMYRSSEALERAVF